MRAQPLAMYNPPVKIKIQSTSCQMPQVGTKSLATPMQVYPIILNEVYVKYFIIGMLIDF